MKASRIDFSRKPGPPLLGWLVLFLGAGLLLCAWALRQHWNKDAETLQRQLALAEREIERQRATARAQAPVPMADARRWAQWQTQLSLPWQVAMQILDATVSDPVYLLGLTWQGGSDGSPGQLKLEAQAPGWNEALVFVDAFQRSLDAAPTPLFGSAQLSSQQQAQDASTGEQVQRFVVMVPLRWASLAAPTQTAKAAPAEIPMRSPP